jgi:hypothetical protein
MAWGGKNARGSVGDTSKESIKMRRCDTVGTSRARIGASLSSERQAGLIIF